MWLKKNKNKKTKTGTLEQRWNAEFFLEPCKDAELEAGKEGRRWGEEVTWVPELWSESPEVTSLVPLPGPPLLYIYVRRG